MTQGQDELKKLKGSENLLLQIRTSENRFKTGAEGIGVHGIEKSIACNLVLQNAAKKCFIDNKSVNKSFDQISQGFNKDVLSVNCYY